MSIKVKGIGDFELPEGQLFVIFAEQQTAAVLKTDDKGAFEGYAVTDSVHLRQYLTEEKKAKVTADLLVRNGATRLTK